MKDSASFQNKNLTSKRSERRIEWIGEIPEDWKISIISYYTTSRSGGTPDRRILQYWNQGTIPWMASGEVNKANVYETNEKITLLGSNNSSAKLLKKNTVMVALNGQGKTKGMSAILRIAAACNQSLCGFFCNSKYLYFGYLFYCFQTMYKYLRSQAGDELRDGLSSSFIKKQRIPLPPTKIQTRIADFLDSKCTKIDSLKNNIKKQIETLEQYKKSIITEAVTKGINPNVKMKYSGIEWIGEIPEDWEIHPIYYYFDERKHKNSPCKEKNLLSLSYGNIIRKDINALGGLLPESFNTYNIIEKDDIVIRPTDLQNDKRSLRTGLCKEHGIITSAYITLKPKKDVNSQYYHYLLHSYDIEKVFYNMGNGVRQGLNYSEFKKLLIISPKLEEQKNIVEYLDSKCTTIDNIINSKKQQLEKLEEYKKSLIFEYVTGKKLVPSCEFSNKNSGKREA